MTRIATEAKRVFARLAYPIRAQPLPACRSGGLPVEDRRRAASVQRRLPSLQARRKARPGLALPRQMERPGKATHWKGAIGQRLWMGQWFGNSPRIVEPYLRFDKRVPSQRRLSRILFYGMNSIELKIAFVCLYPFPDFQKSRTCLELGRNVPVGLVVVESPAGQDLSGRRRIEDSLWDERHRPHRATSGASASRWVFSDCQCSIRSHAQAEHE